MPAFWPGPKCFKIIYVPITLHYFLAKDLILLQWWIQYNLGHFKAVTRICIWGTYFKKDTTYHLEPSRIYEIKCFGEAQRFIWSCYKRQFFKKILRAFLNQVLAISIFLQQFPFLCFCGCLCFGFHFLSFLLFLKPVLLLPLILWLNPNKCFSRSLLPQCQSYHSDFCDSVREKEILLGPLPQSK